MGCFMDILIISGLSGAGKSKAGSYLEDMGFYIVDNMPDDNEYLDDADPNKFVAKMGVEAPG